MSRLLRSVLLVGAVTLFALGCSGTESPELASSTASTVIAGDSVPNPEQSGIVYIRSPQKSMSGSVADVGTGTLLAPDWVLTAAHVVWEAASPDQVEVRAGAHRLAWAARRGRRATTLASSQRSWGLDLNIHRQVRKLLANIRQVELEALLQEDTLTRVT